MYNMSAISKRVCTGIKGSVRPVTLLSSETSPFSSIDRKASGTSLSNAKPFEEIPTFTTLPIIGTSWQYLPVIGSYDLQKQHIAMADKRRKLGDIFREKAGPLNIVTSFNADDMQALFKNEGPYPSRGEFFTCVKAYRESRKQWYSNNGLIILQGKEWHDVRLKVQNLLMKPKSIRSYMNSMQDIARDLVIKIQHSRDSNKEVPNFLEDLYKWALESVAFVGLDTRLGCLDLNLLPNADAVKMIDAIQTAFECINKMEAFLGNVQFWKLFPTPLWKKLTTAGDVFSEITFSHITRALEDSKTSANDNRELTLLQSMLIEKGLDATGAMVVVSDMFMAGVDTTSHTVGFFLYHIAKHPEEQEMVYQEIKNLLPNSEDKITTEIFNELKYMKACIKESGRLLPIAPGTVRTIDHDIVLSGYRVPAGTFVVIANQVMYKDEKYFSNALQYIPERWLEKDEKFHGFAYVPFGVGVRSCIGRRLAELEIISIITEIIRNFRIEYHYEDIGMYTRLINTPDKPLKYRFLDR